MLICVHVQGAEDIHRVTADESGLIGDLLAELSEPGVSLWLEEADVPLDLAASLTAAGVVDRSHMHLSRCRQVEVEVRFGGDTHTRGVSAGRHGERRFRVGVGPKGFRLADAEWAKHTLGVCGTQSEADRDAHVGSLAADCTICFDLAPKVRYAG